MVACVAFIDVGAVDSITGITCAALTGVAADVVRTNGSSLVTVVAIVETFIDIDANQSITSITSNTTGASKGSIAITTDTTGSTVVKSCCAFIDVDTITIKRQ